MRALACSLLGLACGLLPTFLPAATIHVPADQPTLQAAIDAAAPGDTVLVAPGTYTGEGNWDIEWAGKDLHVLSEAGPEVTILDIACPELGWGEPCDYTDPHRAFHLSGGLSAASRLEGFTLRRGCALESAGAILCDGASPTIASCVFEDHVACSTGGAMTLVASSPTIRDCAFRGNRAREAGLAEGGGAIWSDASSAPAIEGCVFEQNRAGDLWYEGWATGRGGAIYSLGPFTVTGCEFTGNAAGGGGGAFAAAGVPGQLIGNSTFTDCGSYFFAGALYVTGEGTVVDGCTFTANTARAASTYGIPVGGAVQCDGSPILRACLFQDNEAFWGGAVNVHYGSASITGCVFVGNVADPYRAEGGGAAVSVAPYASPTISHSTFWGNLAGGFSPRGTIYTEAPLATENCIIASSVGLEAVACGEGGTATLRCCDLYGNTDGDWTDCVSGQQGVNGNISADPRFCHPDSGDFRLSASSPCVANPACGVIGAFGVGCSAVGAEVGEIAGEAAEDLRLEPGRPNPTTGLTRLTYQLPSSGTAEVNLAVYDVTGRRVRTLLAAPQAPGTHTVTWDGKDEHARDLADGVYFLRLCWNGRQETERLILAR